MNYQVNEIFYTLQGEGYFTGRPAVFVRFSGCNLKCPFCDTKFDSFTLMSAEDIVSKIQSLTSNSVSDPTASAIRQQSGLLVVLTGGEPTLQVNKELTEALHRKNYFLAIETNGTNPIPEGIDWITYSPKEQITIHNQVLDQANELKIVYLGQDVEKYYQSVKAEHYYLQPCSNRNTKEVVNYILQHPHWQLSLQTQKIIGIK